MLSLPERTAWRTGLGWYTRGMRSLTRLVALTLLAVLTGAPVWTAACDVTCEATRQRAAVETSSRQPTAGEPSGHSAHHQHEHHQAVAADVAANGAAGLADGTATVCRFVPVDAECQAPSTLTWFAPDGSRDFSTGLPVAGRAATPDHTAPPGGARLPFSHARSDRADRPLAIVLRI